jgi:hypothetical protein
MIELGEKYRGRASRPERVRFIELEMRELEAEEILKNPTNELEKAG